MKRENTLQRDLRSIQRKTAYSILAALLFALALPVSQAMAQGRGNGNGGGEGNSLPYSLVDLKGFTVTYPGGSYIQSAAAAVNEPDGEGTVQVVGISAFKLGDNTDNQSHPVLWEVNGDGSFTRIDLGLPPQAYQAGATDVNDLGEITIKVHATSDFNLDSWVSVPGKPLQLLSNAGDGTRLRINNFGEIVAPRVSWKLTDGVPGDPVNWNGFMAAGIADTGLMAGHDGFHAAFGENPWKDWKNVDGVPTIAWFDENGILQVEWLPQPGVPDDLPFLLSQGSATAISPNGMWVTGFVNNSGTAQAFLWSDATGMIFLDRLGGADCVAVDVNNSGEVVGWSDTVDRNSPVAACLWKGGQVYDLNVLAGTGRKTQLVTARGINGAGHVVGYMDVNVKGFTEEHAFALIPNTQ